MKNGANDQICIDFFALDAADAYVEACTPNDLTFGAWHLIVAGTGLAKDANGNPIGAAAFISLDGGAKQWSSTIGFQIHGGSWQFRLGAGFAGDDPGEAGEDNFFGRIDQLAFWGRELTDSEITLLYGTAGAGQAYPFSTE